jgi:RND family efflux transporter MFP subunit
LASLKEPPARAERKERPLRVEALKVKPEDVQVMITGYAQAKSLDMVDIAAQVSGKVVGVHPNLEAGEVIAEGELLLRIDASDYVSNLKQSKAEVSQLETSLARLEKQYTLDQLRLKTLVRNKDLAYKEFKRLQGLYIDKDIGTRTAMEQAEQAYNAALDKVDLLEQSLELYPLQIKEAKSALNSARARLDKAKIQLERCKVYAPFAGRVVSVELERGQYVSPGQKLLSLADDSLLELRVPLDSREARKWLLFTKSKDRDRAWFSALQQVSCTVRWTEDEKGQSWKGYLHRIVEFDQETRTLVVAVRVPAAEAAGDNSDLPLVDGMFCSVNIPGKVIKKVYRVPSYAVSFENTVFTAADNRLKTVPVEVERIQDDGAYISKGLEPGDLVITTRLVQPLENSLLQIVNDGQEDQSS